MSQQPKKTFREKLGEVRKHVPTTNYRGNKPKWFNDYGVTLPALNSLGEDGVDHINIYNLGNTELGVALSEGVRYHFVHEQYGPFQSVAGFSAWLRSNDEDDLFRTLAGYAVIQLTRTKTFKLKIENIKYETMMAHWYKINSFQRLVDMVVKSDLKFDYYYLYGKQSDQQIRIRNAHANWVVAGFEEIRRALKEKREPNFEKFKEEGRDYGQPNKAQTFKSKPFVAKVNKERQKAATHLRAVVNTDITKEKQQAMASFADELEQAPAHPLVPVLEKQDVPAEAQEESQESANPVSVTEEVTPQDTSCFSTINS
jgi:hypothetical protein